MDGKKLHLYTIMPLDTTHIDEICEDIKKQYETGVATCALFKMTLVPEGNPPVNKAKIMCRQYDLFKEKLLAYGIPNGVLVQASIGHGWLLSEMFPYQKYTNVSDGWQDSVVCPYDEGFRRYIYDAMQEIALHEPDCIMLDDDFRLIFRGGSGCGCPLHIKRFNEMAKTNFSREEIWENICSNTEEGKMYAKIFTDTQKEALLDTAKVMRKGIDSVNPGLPGLFCCVGKNAEFAYEIAEVLAGEGNPVVVRINNGNYTPAGARYLSNAFYRAASQIAKLKDKADIILAETDTCPQNRYSTGAMSLHSHFTGTILEGATGAKHWITRLGTFEPESGVAYRKILGKYSGFYKKLSEITPDLSWRGLRIPVTKTPEFVYRKDVPAVVETINAWGMCVLERFGLPMYFSPDNGGVACFEGDEDKCFSDEEIFDVLKGKVFLASDTAENLIERGFGKYIGVEVRQWQGKQPTGERFAPAGTDTSVQMCTKELAPLDDNAVVDSIVYHSVDGENIEELFPGTVIYKNSLGGTVFIFCGTPRAEYHITQAFSFLTQSRKMQLARFLMRAGECPVYFPGDEEMYFRAADMKDGRLFCAAFNIGLDPIEKLTLICERNISKTEKLMPDGKMEEITFVYDGEKYILDTPCNTLEPVILFIS